MDTHHIHGTEIGFHGNTESAKEFLNKNKSATEGYLDQAKNSGEASFYDNEGNKFKIEHQEKDGKDSFSIHRHY
jgi:hypothetical protein